MNFKEKKKMDFKEMTVGQKLGTEVAPVALWFISAAFIWWGWNIFARHFDLPQFGYMEVFAMRMALACIMRTFWQRTEKKG